MARQFRASRRRRALNAVVTGLVRRGGGPKGTELLTVQGRVSGIPRTTPVTLIEHDGARWLVAPYGERDWVRNVRAADTVTLQRGRQMLTCRPRPVPAEVAAPVLRVYLARVPIVRPYVDVPHDAPLKRFVEAAPKCPVFRLDPAS